MTAWDGVAAAAEARAREAGRWGKLAAQQAENTTSIAEQARNEAAARAADQGEKSWVLHHAAQRNSRDSALAGQAAEAGLAALKDLRGLRDDVKDRKLGEKDTAKRLNELRRERDRLAALADSLDVSVAGTKEMNENPHGYIEQMLRKYPSLNLAHRPLPAPDGYAAGRTSTGPVNVARVRSLLESVRQELYQAEDDFLALADRERRLASLAAVEGDELRAKYPGLSTR